MPGENDQSLNGMTALISGGARGQGLSHARVLGKCGVKVILADIDIAEAIAAASALGKDGIEAAAIELDVRSRSSWDSAVAFTEETFGSLDILVNNAGVGSWADVEEENEETWNEIIAINQTGVFFGMQAAIPAIRRSGGGSIINISAGMAIKASPSCIAYHASKAAVLMLTKSAALTLAREDIRVNSVLPGPVVTDFLAVQDDTDQNAMVAHLPTGRMARPEEVSAAVKFLASPEASYITGAQISVDGGLLAGAPRRVCSRPKE